MTVCPRNLTLSPRERKRFCDASLNARTAIREIRAGEPFHGTVFRDHDREGMRFSREVTNARIVSRTARRRNALAHKLSAKRKLAGRPYSESQDGHVIVIADRHKRGAVARRRGFGGVAAHPARIAS
jgi:hypothetical protein